VEHASAQQDPTSSHQNRVLHELHKQSKQLEDVSIQIKHLGERLFPMPKSIIDLFLKSSQHKVPCILLFTTDDTSMKQKLITKLVPGMKALQLHLLCVNKMEVHKVQGQHGSEVIIEGKHWEKILD
jgi:hypothetical protein